MEKNGCENLSKKRLNGHLYKKLIKSWTRVTRVSAGSLRNGDELSGEGGRVAEPNGCVKADGVNRSFSRLKKQRVDCNSGKKFSAENAAAPDHKPNAHFHSKERKTPSNGPVESSYRGPTGVHSQHENNIGKLRKCWFKRKSSLLFENEERFGKLVFFILSLKDNNQPFLIVAPSGLISAWEAEFSRHESSNIVVYRGNSNVRSCIRSLEFRNEYGCIMFQVLLSTPSVVIEDLRILEGINWGGVIIDDCQRPVIYSILNQIKTLVTNMRLLIANDHIRDRRYAYNQLLSFISSGNGEKENASDSDESDPDDDVSKLKEKLVCFDAYEGKHQTPGFSEYWVPVMLSNVQLEQYCAALLSKSVFLCSYRRIDLSNSLQELLVLERKCCNHPYLVDLDHSLRGSLTKDLPMAEHLDAEIEMSGKLKLLDKCLLHIKEQGLRVLIIFQPCFSPGKISTGDVLDDFILQRFGKDSYVRIGGENILFSKKQAVLNLFNNKEGSQFVFLLERRACLSSIELSSVNTVILFDSDWDPLNDLKALQKISFRSQCQQLKVFRLYSIHTVEEMVLILAKQGLAPDSLQNTSRSTCNTLLSWGALRLFDKIDQIHVHNDSDQSPHLANDHCFFNDVVSEFSAFLSSNKENPDLNTKIILKVQQTKGAYVKNVSLHGEVEAESGSSISSIEKMMRNESSIVYWANVLQGRSPTWKFLSSSSCMAEEEHTDELPEESETHLTETNATRIDGMMNNALNALVQWKPVMKRKRRSCSDQGGRCSAGLGDPVRKNSISFQDIYDKEAGANGKIGLSSEKKKTDCISEKRVQKRSPPLGKESQFAERKGSSSAGVGHPARKKSKSVQDIGDKKAGYNGNIGVSLETKQIDCVSKKRFRKRVPPLGKERKFGKANKLIIRDLPASELIATRLTTNQTHICSARDSRSKLHQVPKYQSLEDSTILDDFDNPSTFLPPVPAQVDLCLDIATSVNTTESFPSNQNMGTLLSCTIQLPQENHTPLEVPHSILLDPQDRDLEIMQKVIEQALKIKQDTKSQLRAEFEKEIDQVTKKYVKLLGDVEMELSQKENELETYFKKINESKSLALTFSANLDSAEGAKFSRTQGGKRSGQGCEKTLVIPRSTRNTMGAGVTLTSSPTIYPSPPVSLSFRSPLVPYHAMPTNFVPTDTTHLPPALPLSSSCGLTCHKKPLKRCSQIPHSGNRPVSEIQPPAPHLRHPPLPAEVSPLDYTQTQNGMLIIPHLTTQGSVSEITYENTFSCPGKATDVSSLSTSELLSQLFSMPS